ncbi:MAG: hypothetical protein VX871_08125 [Pseudomonadota bacterium]|nr:hypothetical protein [Pseudomonadota bacterium]
MPATGQPRRGKNPDIETLSDWIDEINRQPAVYDTGARVTMTPVWPAVDGGRPRSGVAPWKAARRREIASKFGPLAAIAVLGVLYVGYDAVLKQNGQTVSLQTGTLAISQDAATAPQSTKKLSAAAVPAKLPAFRLSLGPVTPGKPAPVNIAASGNDLGGDAVLVFEDLPEGAKLSAGSFASGKWAVLPVELGGLNLTLPAGLTGDLTFSLSLVKHGSTTIHRETYTFPVKGKSVPAEPRVIPGEAPLLKRGQAMIANADISGARLVFQHLAFQGSTAAALALGESYDPVLLSGSRALGIEADADKARYWYERAARDGNDAARERLSALVAPR